MGPLSATRIPGGPVTSAVPGGVETARLRPAARGWISRLSAAEGGAEPRERASGSEEVDPEAFDPHPNWGEGSRGASGSREWGRGVGVCLVLSGAMGSLPGLRAPAVFCPQLHVCVVLKWELAWQSGRGRDLGQGHVVCVWDPGSHPQQSLVPQMPCRA